MKALTLGISGINSWLHSVWFKPGNSDLAPDTDALFMFILWVCIISFVLLMVPMCYWAWRWRRKPGVPPIRTPNHNTVLEVTWIVVPLVIVLFIFFWGFHGYMNAQVARGGAEEIIINAKKWVWAARYPNGAGSPETVTFDTMPQGDRVVKGNVPQPVFVVPAGQPVKFRMSSEDVIHSFYIPDMRLKMDVFPNRYTSMTFVPIDHTGPDQAGRSADAGLMFSDQKPGRDHYIFCAEYCGDNHSEMAGVLRVLPADEYRKTIEEWGDLVGKISLVEVGKLVYTANGCAQCHSLDGSAGTGPTWKNAYGAPVPFEDGSSLDTAPPDAWENYIRESILVPGARIHKGYATGNMPSYQGQLSARQIDGVIAYMRDLAGKGRPDDKLTPEELKAQGKGPDGQPLPPEEKK